MKSSVKVENIRAKHSSSPGGEPLIMPDIEELCIALKANDHHITIETSATVYKSLKLDLASLSPKLSNSTPHNREAGRFAVSHEKNRLNFDTIQRFIDNFPEMQLKFVVAHENDMDEIESILSESAGLESRRRAADARGHGCSNARFARRLDCGDLC